MSLTSTDSSSGDNTWFTPLEILEKLGRFDLDPCSMSFRPYSIAKKQLNMTKDSVVYLFLGQGVFL